VAPSTGEGFEKELGLAHSAAQAAWPTVIVEPDAFFSHLARRLGAGACSLEGLSKLRIADLYLACACELGTAGALEAFDARFGREIQAALRRLRLSDADIEETQQLLRARLFLPRDDARPKIAEYSGRGDLRSWVRVVAVRMGLRALRQQKARSGASGGGDEALDGMPAAGDDPEIEYLKRTYGAEFKVALAEGWKALPIRSRLLLRQYFGHGLSVDEIGAVHRVGRSTAARWVTAAREDLVSRTRDGLMQRLAVGRPEVASILRLIESQLASKMADLVGPSRAPGDS
jgi:RNA polymerase sigma-70 factor (ECF subfamily)